MEGGLEQKLSLKQKLAMPIAFVSGVAAGVGIVLAQYTWALNVKGKDPELLTPHAIPVLVFGGLCGCSLVSMLKPYKNFNPLNVAKAIPMVSRHMRMSQMANILDNKKLNSDLIKDVETSAKKLFKDDYYHHYLAATHANIGNYSESLLNYKKSFELAKTPNVPYDFIEYTSRFLADIVSKPLEKIIKPKHRPLESMISKSWDLLKERKSAKLIKMWDPIVAKNPNDLDLNMFYGEILDLVDINRSSVQWEKNLELILERNFKFESIGETSNKICVLDNPYLGTTFIFKQNDKKSLEREIELTKKAQIIVEGHENYRVSRTLDTLIEKEGESYSVLRQESGVTLYESLKQNKEYAKSHFNEIVDFLALIHARFPYDEVHEKNHIIEKVEKRVFSDDLGLDEKISKKIMDNYAPLTESFKKANYTFNKDAHPENWMITVDGKIVAIDFDHTALVPQQFDLANLLEYGDYLSKEEKEGILETYYYAFNRYSNVQIQDFNEFKLIYNNAVIQRSLTLCSAWSSPKRTKMRNEREVMIQHSLDAIENIRGEHSSYYIKYQKNYDNLREALISAKLHIQRDSAR